MRDNLKVRSANKTLVRFDGKDVGLIQSVRMSDDYGLEGASGVGDIHIQEHVPTQARHSLSVSSMVLNKGSLRKAGISTINGDGALKGLVFDFLVTDRETGQVLRKYIGCSYGSGDVDVTKHQIIMSSAQFMALDVEGDDI